MTPPDFGVLIVCRSIGGPPDAFAHRWHCAFLQFSIFPRYRYTVAGRISQIGDIRRAREDVGS